jgi:hypothetical protein
MISIDNLLQCLLLIIMIGLSKTCDIFATLICNALIMFVIYSWIKIKLKVLIYPTIQKLYCSYFSFMTGFVDALRHTSFTDANSRDGR